MHAVCHATTNPICMALLSSLPVIENCQYRGLESVSDSISVIEAPTLNRMWLRLCTHYIDDLVPYYEPLYSYWACGQIFHIMLTSNNSIHFKVSRSYNYRKPP